MFSMIRHVMALSALVAGLAAHGQQILVLEGDTAIPRQWRGPFKVDSAQVDRRTADLRAEMIAEGYLAASCDTCIAGKDTIRCHFHLGAQYRWARLRAGSLPQEVASATGFRERFYAGRAITPVEVAKLLNGLLKECEDHGYPFAVAGLDSLQEEQGELSASLYLEKGTYVTMDSIVVRGSARINPRYLQAYIGIKPGDPYNESLVRDVDARTRELPFVSTRQPAYLLFAPTETKLYLFLDARRASNFSGIIGLAQDAVTGKVRFTGDLDLKLRNALHRGEAMNLSWRSLQDRTQNLLVGYNHPFLFNSPFGADLSLKLFKRDTSFLEVTSQAALEYLMKRGDKLKVFISSKSSQRLGQQLVYVPGLADVKVTAYGLGLVHEHYDYRFNPRKGLGVDIQGSVGRKRTSTSTFSDSASTVQHSVQYEVAGTVVKHFPVGKRGTIRLAAQGASMVNGQLYSNELYRIGGIKTQRGVDEASIYASSYAIGTLEYRFLFEENGNFFAFVDQGWWEDQSRPALLTDTPLGFGAGASFETKAGIFSLSYALGKQFNNPVELRNGKVHFGFTSLF